jgi:lactoylglutathione lyase
MKFDRTGIILYVHKYKECIEFYEQIIGLKPLFITESITCFEFNNSYLMVEFDDENLDIEGQESFRTRTCLRMNVKDVKDFAENLTKKNIPVNYQEHSWGTVAKFHDPDGNICAFKDSEKFEEQIKDYQDNGKN